VNKGDYVEFTTRAVMAMPVTDCEDIGDYKIVGQIVQARNYGTLPLLLVEVDARMQAMLHRHTATPLPLRYRRTFWIFGDRARLLTVIELVAYESRQAGIHAPG